jgi:purine-nucleoside phosphorylase
MTNLYTSMHESAEFICSRGIGKVDGGMILGSGLTAMNEILDEEYAIPYGEIPHLRVSGAPGHEGVLRYGSIGNKQVLMFCGRLHYYEGYPMWQVSYPIRIMQALEVQQVIVTAAAGGLNTDFSAGDLVLITDHINLMPDNPLRGLVDPRMGERFPDMTTAYDQTWQDLLLTAARTIGMDLKTGIYAGLQGPSLETQAECAFLRSAGADLVGMSVVPEVIAGVQAGIRMSAICIVSNMAWHPGDLNPSTVPEILATADAAVPRLTALIKASYSIS